MYAYLRPGVFGLETFTTSASAYGPNVCTPATKSAIESGGDDLFFPKFTARSAFERSDACGAPCSGYSSAGSVVAEYGARVGRRARRRARTAACPSEGKP